MVKRSCTTESNAVARLLGLLLRLSCLALGSVQRLRCLALGGVQGINLAQGMGTWIEVDFTW